MGIGPEYLLHETYKNIDIYLNIYTYIYRFYWAGTPYDYGTIEQCHAKIDSLTMEEEPEVYAEHYKGVILWYNTVTRIYHFTWEGEERYFGTLEAARAAIDELTAPPPEVPPTPPPEPVPVGAPSGNEWISDLASWWGDAWEGGMNWLGDRGKDLASSLGGLTLAVDAFVTKIETGGSGIVGALAGLPAALIAALMGSLGDIFKRSADESIARALETVGKVTAESPEWKKSLDATLGPYGAKAIDDTLKALSPAALGKSPLSAEEAATTAQTMMYNLTGLGIGAWLAHAAAEAATLGQYEAIKDLVPMVFDRLGLSQLGAKAIGIPLEELIFKRAQQHWAAQFTPEIPATTDLISMVVKEVITIEEFKQWMRFKGFAPDWSQYIWDAHFIAPTLTDLLTAWRRGLIDEAELDRLMILVDLDPRFKTIFDTRKYITPSLSLTRFLWETGAIGREEVERNVKLEGYHPDHVPAIVSFICEFQERLWRRRYLVTLSGGYQRGVYSADELDKAVTGAGYTPDVAKWIIANADARKKIAEAKVAVEKPKLLSVGDLKKAYIANMISTDDLRTELLTRGYPIDQADLLIRLLDQEKVVEAAGGAKVALSQAELVNAWRYEEITEDQLRTELQLRGLSLDEVNILINTKKKQWGVGGELGP